MASAVITRPLPRETEPPVVEGRGYDWSRLAPFALVAVCVLHVLLPLVMFGTHVRYGWDETVYVSQYNHFGPAEFFSAPRARGVPLIVSPVAMLTPSLAVMRVYLAVLSGVLMYVGFRPWQRLRPGYAVPFAALLLTSIWVSIVYTTQAMPNQFVAFGALAATGYLLLAQREPSRARYVVWLGLAVAATSLVRPSDSLFLAVPLVACALVRPGARLRRRFVLVGAVLAGLAVGVGQWVVEAYTSFGGPAARLREASAENTGGLHLSLGKQADVLAGPWLCRDGCVASAPTAARVWWYVAAVLIVIGVVAAVRWRRAALGVLPAATAAAMGAQYVFFIDYAAPRFLLPTYALASLPVSFAVVWCLGHGRARRCLVGAVVVLVLAAHVAVQLDIAQRQGTRAAQGTLRTTSIGEWLRAQGVSPPCVVVGQSPSPVAFAAGCRNTPWDPASLAALARSGTTDIAWVRPAGVTPNALFASWPSARVDHAAVPTAPRVYLWLPDRDAAATGAGAATDQVSRFQ